MENADTIKLLQECDAGTKMAVTSIEEVLDKLQDKKLIDLLSESKRHHEKLGNDLHELLREYRAEDKEPGLMAKSMSWFKTNMKVGMSEDSDAEAARLMTDGCDMGIKSLHKYLNQYKEANHTAKAICSRLINIEETLRSDLQRYL